MAGTLRLPLLVVLALALAHVAAAQQQPANTTGEPSLSPVSPITNASTDTNTTAPAVNTTVVVANTTANTTAPVDPLANITAPSNATADSLLIRTVLPESRRFGETADEPTQAEFRKAQLARLVTLFGRLLEAHQRKLQRTRADIFDASIRRTAAEQQANAYDAETAATITSMRKLQGRIERLLVKLQGWALRNLRRQTQEAVTASFTARVNNTNDAKVLRLSRAHVRHADWNVLKAYQYLRTTLRKIHNRELLREAGKPPTEAELLELFKDIAEARAKFQANRGFLANARDNVFEARERLNWHDSSLATYTNLLNQTTTLVERMKKFLAYHQAYYKPPPPEPEPQIVDVHVQAHVLVGPDGQTTVRLENSNAPQCVDSDADGICDSRRVGPFKVTDAGKLIDARNVTEVATLPNKQQMEAGKAVRTVIVPPALADEAPNAVRPTEKHPNREFLPPIPPRPTTFSPSVIPQNGASRQHNDFDSACAPGSKWYPNCKVRTNATIHVDIDANGVPTITTLTPAEQTFRPKSRDPSTPLPPESDPEIKAMVEHITQMEKMSQDVAQLAKLLEQHTNTTNTILLQVEDEQAPLSPNGQSGVPVSNDTANATAYNTPAPSSPDSVSADPNDPENNPHADAPDQPIVKQNQNFSYTSIAASPDQLLQPFNAPSVNNTNVSSNAPLPRPSLFPQSGFMEDELDAEEVDRELAFDAAMIAKYGSAADAPPTPAQSAAASNPDEVVIEGVVSGNWRVPIRIATPPNAPAPPQSDPIKSNASDGAPQVFGAPEEEADVTLDKQDRVHRKEFKPLQIVYTDAELESIKSWETQLGIPPPPPPPVFGAVPPAPSMPHLPPPPNWNGTSYDDSWLQPPPAVKPPSSHPTPASPAPATPITAPPVPPSPPVLPPPTNTTKHFIPPTMDNTTTNGNQTFQHVWEEDTSDVDNGGDDEPGALKPPVWQTSPKPKNNTNETENQPKKDYSGSTQLSKPYIVSPSEIKNIPTNPADWALANFTRVVSTTIVTVKPRDPNDLVHRRDGEQQINTTLVHNNTQVNDTSQTAANQPGNGGGVVDGRPVPGVTWTKRNTTSNTTATNGTDASNATTNATTNATVPANTTVTPAPNATEPVANTTANTTVVVNNTVPAGPPPPPPKPPVIPSGKPLIISPRLPYNAVDNTTINDQIPVPPRPGKKDPAPIDVLTVHSEPKGSNISVPVPGAVAPASAAPATTPITSSNTTGTSSSTAAANGTTSTTSGTNTTAATGTTSTAATSSNTTTAAAAPAAAPAPAPTTTTTTASSPAPAAPAPGSAPTSAVSTPVGGAAVSLPGQPRLQQAAATQAQSANGDFISDELFNDIGTQDYDPKPPSDGDRKPFPDQPVCIACAAVVPTCACQPNQLCTIQPQTCTSCARAVCTDLPPQAAPAAPAAAPVAVASNGVRYITPLNLISPVVKVSESSSSSSSSSESSRSESSSGSSSSFNSYRSEASSASSENSLSQQRRSLSEQSESSRSSSFGSESSRRSEESSSSSGNVLSLKNLFESSQRAPRSESSSESSSSFSRNRESSESSESSSQPATAENVQADAEQVEKLPPRYPTSSTSGPSVSLGTPFTGSKGTTDPVEAEAEAVESKAPVAPPAPKLITFSSPKSGVATDVVKESYPSTIVIPQPNARFMETTDDSDSGAHRLRSLLYRRRGRTSMA